MLYTVEIDFTNPAEEPAWDAWYHGNLPLMVSAVPGFQHGAALRKGQRTRLPLPRGLHAHRPRSLLQRRL